MYTCTYMPCFSFVDCHKLMLYWFQDNTYLLVISNIRDWSMIHVPQNLASYTVFNLLMS